jgi:PPM family protein phosphatase
MTPSALKISAAGHTDVGLRRQHNEDAFTCEPDSGLYIVADGMGGHAAGEIASAKAVEAMREFILSFQGNSDFTWPFGVVKNLSPPQNLLLSAIRLANRDVCALAQDHPEYSGMGTTVVACLLEDHEAVIGHVGDSRAYLLRDDTMTQLTEDHSWVNEQVQQQLLTEEEAKTHRWRNIITRALGNRFDVDVDLKGHALREGDTLLLCTDGLSGPVPESTIKQIVEDCGENVDEGCDQLIAEANRGGGPDNITVVLIHVSRGA